MLKLRTVVEGRCASAQLAGGAWATNLRGRQLCNPAVVSRRENASYGFYELLQSGDEIIIRIRVIADAWACGSGSYAELNFQTEWQITCQLLASTSGCLIKRTG
jgi:hypothetical protein